MKYSILKRKQHRILGLSSSYIMIYPYMDLGTKVSSDFMSDIFNWLSAMWGNTDGGRAEYGTTNWKFIKIVMRIVTLGRVRFLSPSPLFAITVNLKLLRGMQLEEPEAVYIWQLYRIDMQIREWFLVFIFHGKFPLLSNEHLKIHFSPLHPLFVFLGLSPNLNDHLIDTAVWLDNRRE